MTTANHIAVGLSKIGLFLRSQARREGEASGISPTQAQILAYVAARGATRIGALAAELGVRQPTVSDAVAALARKGYVEKQVDPTDARATQLLPTEAGRRLSSGMAVWPDALLAAVQDFEPAEQGVLLRTLTKMIRALQVQGAIPLQRMCVTCRYFRPYVHRDAARPHHCAFVDAAFGDAALRLDCGDHGEAESSLQRDNWSRFKEAPARG